MIDLHHGDCLDIMPTLEADSVDTVICDPPYGLSFMGKDWDHGVPGPRFWAEALRVAKPGAMLLAFGGSRTFHRLACAIEDAGWELRDTVMWVYGSGFPKSHDISKAIDRAAGAEREVVQTVRKLASAANVHKGWERPWAYENGKPKRTMDITAPATPAAETWHGWGTALKPAWEPVIVAMKPLAGTFAQNALQHGVAGLWIDGARVEADEQYHNGYHSDETKVQGQVYGWAQSDKFVRCAPSSSGRWPANLIHDGSDEVLAGFPASTSNGGTNKTSGTSIGGNGSGAYQGGDNRGFFHYNDTGSAARFFYCAKASRSERNAGLEGMEAVIRNDGRGEHLASGDVPMNRSNNPKQNHHPTVKPIALMRYLARLTKTPTGGVVLDPFMGSGSTGIGAVMEGRDFIGIEQDADYIEIARRRIEHWQAEAEREAAQLELQFD